MSKFDYTWLLLGGAATAIYLGTRPKKKPPATASSAEALDDEAPTEGDTGPTGSGRLRRWGKNDSTSADIPDDCLAGWEDSDLQSLMADRAVEIHWTGQEAGVRAFQITQSAVAELCPQLYQPESYEDARDTSDPTFRHVWDRLNTIAWRVAFGQA